MNDLKKKTLSEQCFTDMNLGKTCNWMNIKRNVVITTLKISLGEICFPMGSQQPQLNI